MGIFTKLKDLVGAEEYEDEYEEVDEKSYKQPSYSERKPAEPRGAGTSGFTRDSNVVPMQNRTVKSITNALKLVVIEPQSFDECPRLVDSLKSRKPIIVNLEKLEPDVMRKIFDFLNGATYALNGKAQKIANNIIVFAPENVDITAEGTNKTVYGTKDDGKDSHPWK